MKSINAVFVYILLTIVLCTRNVFTLCGNKTQIDDLQTTIIIHESGYTLLTILSAIPMSGAFLVFAQAMMSATFGINLQESFREMEASLNKDDKDYQKCSEILEETVTAAGVIKSTTVGLSLAAMLPGVNLVLVPPRLGASITAMILIRDGLTSWQNDGCQYTTKRDCKL